MKGRKPYSQAVLKASDAFKKHPERENKNEPKPMEGAPNKPAHIEADFVASQYWDHFVQQLDQMKILTKADRSILEVLCELMSFRKSAFNASDMKEHKQLCVVIKGYLAELGLTPSARSRLIAKSPDTEDAFQEWQKGFPAASDN